MVSIAAFLVVGFFKASCTELAAELTACDLAILLNKSGRDAKYLRTTNEEDQGVSPPKKVRSDDQTEF